MFVVAYSVNNNAAIMQPPPHPLVPFHPGHPSRMLIKPSSELITHADTMVWQIFVLTVQKLPYNLFFLMTIKHCY